MSNKAKVEKAIQRIHELGLEDVIHNPENIYQEMRNESLFELAELITDMSNAIYDLRDILEGEL